MFQLNKGIFLENKNVLLKWKQPLRSLADENNAEIIKLADRLIINWGVHKILNGLELNLSNTFLGTPNFLLGKKFTDISAWAVGDKEANEFFNTVSHHLKSIFGLPEKEDPKGEHDEFWIWQTDDVDITLHLFEQHCFKCCLSIDQNE